MTTIEIAKCISLTGVEHKTNWLKDIPYESAVVVYDSRKSGLLEDKERSAFYFGYNEREQFNLFLRREKEEVEMYIIKDEKCWVKHWGECGIPCLDTEYIGNLEKSKRFPNGDEEKKYALKRLKELNKN
jgi:hypothetical protein